MLYTREQFIQRYVIAQMANKPDYKRRLKDVDEVLLEASVVYDHLKERFSSQDWPRT